MDTGKILGSQTSLNVVSINDTKSSVSRTFMNVISISLICFFVILTFVWIFCYEDGISFGKRSANTHLLFCSLGTIFLMGLASLSYKFITCGPYILSKSIHVSLMFFGIILLSIGMYAIMYTFGDYVRFQSVHSCIGLVTYILILLQFIASFLINVLPCIPYEFKQKFKNWHIIFGKILLLLSSISIITGLLIIQMTNESFYYSTKKNFLGFYSLITILTSIALFYKLHLAQ